MSDISIPRDRLGTIQPDGSVLVSKSWLRFFMQLTGAVNSLGGTSLYGEQIPLGLLYASDDASHDDASFADASPLFIPQEFIDKESVIEIKAEAAQSEAAFFMPVSDVNSEVKAQPVSVSPGVSPATITASRNGWYIVSAGTVSALDYSRAGGSFISLGVSAGMFPVSSGDAIKITYTVVPTVYFVPR